VRRRFVAKGHFWLAPGIFENYLTQMRKGPNDVRQVTPRESEILDLLRLRLSNKESRIICASGEHR